MTLPVTRIDRTAVKVPFREVPERNMMRQLPYQRYFEICEVELADEHVGYGETSLFRPKDSVTDAEVERTLGRNAAELLWNESLTVGLRTALFDAVGRALDVPVHRFLGTKHRDCVPLAWWAIDMSPDDLVSEAREARNRGYTRLKLKGRPWFDIRAQVGAVSEALSNEFRLSIDFNETLLDADRAIPLLQELERYPQVVQYEEPIPPEVVDGYRAIREAVETDIALHYGRPGAITALEEDICDGFVVGGASRTVRTKDAVARVADAPVFLQRVGTGITAAFALHLCAVLEQVRWPAITCHHVYEHPLVTDPIAVSNGEASVPAAPGLGYEVDVDAIERFSVDYPASEPNPPRLVEVRWTDGTKMYFASNRQTRHAKNGDLPFYEPGVTARVVPDDGSDGWRRLYERALEDEPVVAADGDPPE